MAGRPRTTICAKQIPGQKQQHRTVTYPAMSWSKITSAIISKSNPQIAQTALDWLVI
jgi:hypothetical protein